MAALQQGIGGHGSAHLDCVNTRAARAGQRLCVIAADLGFDPCAGKNVATALNRRVAALPGFSDSSLWVTTSPLGCCTPTSVKAPPRSAHQ